MLMSRVVCRRVAQVARIHTSVPRSNLLQDLYVKEVSAFKPKPLTEKDAEGVVVKWATPSVPKAPTVEGDVSEVDAYAKEPVEVDSAPAAAATGSDAAASDDWFPLEEIVEEHH